MVHTGTGRLCGKGRALGGESRVMNRSTARVMPLKSRMRLRLLLDRAGKVSIVGDVLALLGMLGLLGVLRCNGGGLFARWRVGEGGKY